MADYADLYAIAANDTFLGRVALAVEKKAVAIAAESSAGLNPARKRLAAQVLRDPVGERQNLALVVVRDGTIASKTSPITQVDVSDAEIDAALSDQVWDGYAEAFA